MGLLPGGEDVRGTLVLHSRYSYLGGRRAGCRSRVQFQQQVRRRPAFPPSIRGSCGSGVSH